MTPKTYTITDIHSITTDEVDYKLYLDLFGKKQVDEIYEESHPSEYIIDKSSTRMYPMSIEYLESIIAKLKAKGANYVAIDYNCDHPDYTFNGCSIKEATKEIIQAKEDKYNRKLEKDAKRQELLKQLKELDNE
jgi:hypothetical protein